MHRLLIFNLGEGAGVVRRERGRTRSGTELGGGLTKSCELGCEVNNLGGGGERRPSSEGADNLSGHEGDDFVESCQVSLWLTRHHGDSKNRTGGDIKRTGTFSRIFRKHFKNNGGQTPRETGRQRRGGLAANGLPKRYQILTLGGGGGELEGGARAPQKGA
jgi:hypothetical protein